MRPDDKDYNGEAHDETVFSCRACLYHFERGVAQSGEPAKKAAWKVRGVGQLRINILPDRRSRLVMRQTGNLRLMLNALLLPEMALQCPAGSQQVSFSCINVAMDAPPPIHKDGDMAAESEPQERALATYAIKFGSTERAQDFLRLAEHHKQPRLQSDSRVREQMEAIDAVAASMVQGSIQGSDEARVASATDA